MNKRDFKRIILASVSDSWSINVKTEGFTLMCCTNITTKRSTSIQD